MPALTRATSAASAAAKKPALPWTPIPGQTFDGEVRQVRKAAQNVANVVTYVAVVGFTNAGRQTAARHDGQCAGGHRPAQDVLKVPNAALRVRIAGVEPAAQGASAPGGGTSGRHRALPLARCPACVRDQLGQWRRV